jgi:hypothetical protein
MWFIIPTVAPMTETKEKKVNFINQCAKGLRFVWFIGGIGVTASTEKQQEI